MKPRKRSVEQVLSTFQEYYSPTCQSTFRFIEGYMIKDIDGKSIMHSSKRHLRFFRIIFSNARLDLKEDKADKKMKTFALSEIKGVEILSSDKGQAM